MTKMLIKQFDLNKNYYFDEIAQEYKISIYQKQKILNNLFFIKKGLFTIRGLDNNYLIF
jgi:hypothetical protein